MAFPKMAAAPIDIEHFLPPQAAVSMFSGQQILFTYKVQCKIGLLQCNAIINERKRNRMARLSLHVIVITWYCYKNFDGRGTAMLDYKIFVTIHPWYLSLSCISLE